MRLWPLISILALGVLSSTPVKASQVACAFDDELARMSIKSDSKGNLPTQELVGFRGAMSLKKVPVPGMRPSFLLNQAMIDSSTLGPESMQFHLTSESKTENPFVELTLDVDVTSQAPDGLANGRYTLSIAKAPSRIALERETVLNHAGTIACRLR